MRKSLPDQGNIRTCLILFFSFVKQTRILDWREGALSSDYVLRCLDNTVEKLKEYEAQIPPPDWTYVWDRWVIVLVEFLLNIHCCHMVFV